jgi:hypothetical protein
MDFFAKLEQVVSGTLPLLTAVATFSFPQIAIVPKLLSLLPGMIELAESIFGGGQGPLKKRLVMESAQKAVEIMAENSTGGQKATWETLSTFVSLIIDAFVAGTKTLGAEWDDQNRSISAG